MIAKEEIINHLNGYNGDLILKILIFMIV